MNIDRQAGWCVHYWHCVCIRCVGGYSLYVILQLLGLFIIARGLGWVFGGLAGGVQVGGGGIFNWKKNAIKKCSWGLKTRKKISFKNVPGVLKCMHKIIYFSGGGGILGCLGRPTPHRGSRGVGKRSWVSSRNKKHPLILTFRYIDDVLSLNNPKFNDYIIDVIYPKELEIIDTTDAPKLANYLDHLEFVEDGKLFTRLVWQVWWLWFPYSQFSILK